MPWIPNVVPGAPILSTWGNQVRDATIIHFATTAERDTSWPAPPVGARCITLDTLTTWIFNGTAWAVDPVNVERVLAETRALASGSVGTTETVIGAALPITVVAGRNYYAQLHLPVVPGSGNNLATARLRLTNLAGAILGFAMVSFPAAVQMTLSGKPPLNGLPAGAATVQLTLQSAAGTTSIAAGNMLQILERTPFGAGTFGAVPADEETPTQRPA